jgi:tRNA-dihydrouridine synthase A
MDFLAGAAAGDLGTLALGLVIAGVVGGLVAGLLGVDDQEPEQALRATVQACVGAGVDTFIVHARMAWLKGLSPKENRDVPPLDYDLVYRVKRENPQLIVVVNGGIANLDDAQGHLAQVDGVMLGRAAYHDPAILLDVDGRFFGGERRSMEDVLEDYIQYIERQLARGVPLNTMTKHMLGLFNGQPGGRLFRRHLSENATRRGAGLEVLLEALAKISRLSLPRLREMEMA